MCDFCDKINTMSCNYIVVGELPLAQVQVAGQSTTHTDQDGKIRFLTIMWCVCNVLVSTMIFFHN